MDKEKTLILLFFIFAVLVGFIFFFWHNLLSLNFFHFLIIISIIFMIFLIVILYRRIQLSMNLAIGIIQKDSNFLRDKYGTLQRDVAIVKEEMRNSFRDVFILLEKLIELSEVDKHNSSKKR